MAAFKLGFEGHKRGGIRVRPAESRRGRSKEAALGFAPGRLHKSGS